MSVDFFVSTALASGLILAAWFWLIFAAARRVESKLNHWLMVRGSRRVAVQCQPWRSKVVRHAKTGSIGMCVGFAVGEPSRPIFLGALRKLKMHGLLIVAFCPECAKAAVSPMGVAAGLAEGHIKIFELGEFAPAFPDEAREFRAKMEAAE